MLYYSKHYIEQAFMQDINTLRDYPGAYVKLEDIVGSVVLS